MSWREDGRTLVALTRTLAEALRRDDLAAAGSLLAEREACVRRFAAAAAPHRGEPDLVAVAAVLAAAERELATQLSASMAATGHALGRFRAGPSAPPPPSSRQLDRKV